MLERRAGVIRSNVFRVGSDVDSPSGKVTLRPDQARGEGWLPPPWPRPYYSAKCLLIVLNERPDHSQGEDVGRWILYSAVGQDG